MDLLHKDITDKIIKSFYKMYNVLGFGFLEKVYENALFLELIEMGLLCEKQKQIKVFYNGQKVGDYFSDIIVNNCLIIELKAADAICEEHELQLINCLKEQKLKLVYF